MEVVLSFKQSINYGQVLQADVTTCKTVHTTLALIASPAQLCLWSLPVKKYELQIKIRCWQLLHLSEVHLIAKPSK